MKCIITDLIKNTRICRTMENAERLFGIHSLVDIMKGKHLLLKGEIVSSDVPLGYVKDHITFENGYL